MTTHEATYEELVTRHYYCEGNELSWAMKAFFDGLTADEQEQFRQFFGQRLRERRSVLEVSLCGVLPVPELLPILHEILDDAEEPNLLTRMTLDVLGQYAEPSSFASVASYTDSSQNMDALRALSAIDFQRSLDYLRRALHQDELLETCLHIFAQHFRAMEKEQALHVLKELTECDPSFYPQRLCHMFRVKASEVNPLSDEQVAYFLEGLQ